ncbi:DUF7511 domain-containing protein [Natrialbaceae archaeon A-gly3]
MSPEDEVKAPESETLETYPQFALSCLYDDEDDPAEVTIVDETATDRLESAWVTIDHDAVVSLDRAL